MAAVLFSDNSAGRSTSTENYQTNGINSSFVLFGAFLAEQQFNRDFTGYIQSDRNMDGWVDGEG
jgi:hypothetical protein